MIAQAAGKVRRNAVPPAVRGGAGTALFGSVAASGTRTLSTADDQGHLNQVIVAVPIALGLIPVAAPDERASPVAAASLQH